MRRGFTLAELAVVLAILAVVTAITLPRLLGLLDWIAVNTAAQDVTTAVAVTRNAAIMQSSRRRLVIARDSLHRPLGGGLLGASGALARPGSARGHPRGVDPRGGVRPDRAPVGRVQYQGRAAAGCAIRNDHDVPPGPSEALIGRNATIGGGTASTTRGG